MQRLKPIWRRLTTRMPSRRAAQPTDDLAAVSQQYQDLATVRWWYWRHHFLEAQRLRLDAQRDQ